MKSEKKIFLDRLDELHGVVDRIIEASGEKIIVNVPKDSALGNSVQNFQILKRETTTAGKELKIESIDDHILELAGLAGIEAENPVFKIKERTVSDILPRGNFSKPIEEIQKKVDTEPVAPKKVASRRSESSAKLPVGKMEPIIFSKPVEPAPAPVPPPKEKEAPKKEEVQSQYEFFKKVGSVSKESTVPLIDATSRSRSPFKKILLITFLVLVLGGVFVVATRVLPSAKVSILLKENPLSFQERLLVTSQAKTFDITNPSIVVVPGELLLAKKNLTQTFSGHNTQKVTAKATGNLVVYNTYSSAPQALVATTRFESPDHKIFRLVKAVTIPGAKIENGKITASSISVSVIADEPGDSYNIPPVSSWKIPGFKGSPRYEGFYAESLESMVGGFVGTRAVPTADDIATAKKTLEGALKAALQTQISVLLSSKFKVLPEANKLSITKEDVSPNPDAQGMYSVYGEAELRYIVFEEGTLQDALLQKWKDKVDASTHVKRFNVQYDKPTIDFVGGAMNVNASGTVVSVADVNPRQVTSQILGKDENALKSFLFGLQGVEKANVSLWPFWVHSVPSQEAKVTVTVN